MAKKYIRGDMAMISHDALITPLKGSEQLLIEKLGIGTGCSVDYIVTWCDLENYKEDVLNTKFYALNDESLYDLYTMLNMVSEDSVDAYVERYLEHELLYPASIESPYKVKNYHEIKRGGNWDEPKYKYDTVPLLNAKGEIE